MHHLAYHFYFRKFARARGRNTKLAIEFAYTHA
jgi:hypothetical protein